MNSMGHWDNDEQLFVVVEQLQDIVSKLTEQAEPRNSRFDATSVTGGENPHPQDAIIAPLIGLPRATTAESNLIRHARPALPDPRLVRRIIRQRRLRNDYFDTAEFADPMWDMLLDLTAARADHQRVSTKALCIASGVPPTTALRWIGQMVDAGLIERIQDDADRRRFFLRLTDRAARSMARYFEDVISGLGLVT